jgi:hypothetical protein
MAIFPILRRFLQPRRVAEISDFLINQMNRAAKSTMIKNDDLYRVALSIYDKAIRTNHADSVASEMSVLISVRDAGMPRLVVTNRKKASSWEWNRAVFAVWVWLSKDTA